MGTPTNIDWEKYTKVPKERIFKLKPIVVISSPLWGSFLIMALIAIAVKLFP